jgi:peptidylprolyl isomerase
MRRAVGVCLVLTVALAALLIGCSGDDDPSQATADGEGTSVVQQTDGNAPGIPELHGEVQRTSSGLEYIDEQVGDGASPQRGQRVSVQYTGWLTDGKKFDSSRDHGQAFAFPLGTGYVIPAWDEGVASMKVGGKRRLIVPPELGYGARGAPPVIPPNATLIFDVELLGAQ